MARFVFKLDAALRQRQHIEQQCKLQLAARLRELTAIEDAIRRHRRVLDEERLELRERLARGGGAVELHGLRLQANASASLVGAIHHQGLQLAGATERVEQARRALHEAATRRRAIEQLRERRYEQWLRAESIREAAELDDLVMTRASRRDDEERL